MQTHTERSGRNISAMLDLRYKADKSVLESLVINKASIDLQTR